MVMIRSAQYFGELLAEEDHLVMRRRLGLVQAIKEDPKILILDEPANGLDNWGRGCAMWW